jgi:hypothetical protein
MAKNFVHKEKGQQNPPDRKVDIKDNHLGIKLIPMISTWDQVDPIFPVILQRGNFLTFFNGRHFPDLISTA